MIKNTMLDCEFIEEFNKNSDLMISLYSNKMPFKNQPEISERYFK